MAALHGRLPMRARRFRQLPFVPLVPLVPFVPFVPFEERLQVPNIVGGVCAGRTQPWNERSQECLRSTEVLQGVAYLDHLQRHPPHAGDDDTH